MNILYVAWQNQETREWIPVAKLERIEQGYRLSYTAGARRVDGFGGLARMDDLSATYESPVLFAVFANRIIAKSRPEYSDYLRWTGLSVDTADAMQILGVTGGIRGTDPIELFSLPVLGVDGWNVDFFIRGISHLPEEASRAISEVQENDQLFLMLDVQNDFDKNAIAIRTGAPSTLVGYCPKYYCAFVNDAIRRGAGVAVNAKRVNPAAPKSMKLLCTMHVKLKAEAAKNCFGHPDLLPYADNGYGLAP